MQGQGWQLKPEHTHAPRGDTSSRHPMTQPCPKGLRVCEEKDEDSPKHPLAAAPHLVPLLHLPRHPGMAPLEDTGMEQPIAPPYLFTMRCFCPLQSPCACCWHQPRSPLHVQTPFHELKAPGSLSNEAEQHPRASRRARQSEGAPQGRHDRGHPITKAPSLFWSRGSFEAPAGDPGSPSGGDTSTLRRALAMDAVRWDWVSCGSGGGRGDLRSVQSRPCSAERETQRPPHCSSAPARTDALRRRDFGRCILIPRGGTGHPLPPQ